MDQGTCKGCGRPILWATIDGTGKTVPLDPRAPVYEERWPGVVAKITGVWVSHFATCPKANDFSASNKQDRLL